MSSEISSGSEFLDLKPTHALSRVAPLIFAPAGEEKKKALPISGEPLRLQISGDVNTAPLDRTGIFGRNRVRFEDEPTGLKMSGIAHVEKYGVGALNWSDGTQWTRIFNADGAMAQMILPREYQDVSPKVMTLARKGDTLVQNGTLPINLPTDIRDAYFGMVISIAPRRTGWIDLMDKYPKISTMYPNLRSRLVMESCLRDPDIRDLSEKIAGPQTYDKTTTDVGKHIDDYLKYSTREGDIRSGLCTTDTAEKIHQSKLNK